MKLITNVYNPSESGVFAYAFVDLTRELADLILQRRRVLLDAKAHDSSNTLECLEYRDFHAIFLNAVPDETELPETDAGGDFDETELDFENESLSEYTERIDGGRMVITDSGVYWTAYPHYADRASPVETSYIDYLTVESNI